MGVGRKVKVSYRGYISAALIVIVIIVMTVIGVADATVDWY